MLGSLDSAGAILLVTRWKPKGHPSGTTILV